MFIMNVAYVNRYGVLPLFLLRLHHLGRFGPAGGAAGGPGPGGGGGGGWGRPSTVPLPPPSGSP